MFVIQGLDLVLDETEQKAVAPLGVERETLVKIILA
jgi:hypothetical protein